VTAAAAAPQQQQSCRAGAGARAAAEATLLSGASRTGLLDDLEGEGSDEDDEIEDGNDDDDDDDDERSLSESARRSLTMMNDKVFHAPIAALAIAAKQVEALNPLVLPDSSSSSSSSRSRANSKKRLSPDNSPLKKATNMRTMADDPPQRRRTFAGDPPQRPAPSRKTSLRIKAELLLVPTLPVVNQPCNCKKSRCLKLYCECFAARAYCSSCNCADCANNQESEPQRTNAIKATLERNIHAFKPKIAASSNVSGPGVGTSPKVAAHTKGCHCKKSNCLKKYCECFLGNVLCGPTTCKCTDCKNFEGSVELKRRRNGEKDPLPAPAPLPPLPHSTIPILGGEDGPSQIGLLASLLASPQPLSAARRAKRPAPASDERGKTIADSGSKRKRREDDAPPPIFGVSPLPSGATTSKFPTKPQKHDQVQIRDAFLASV
jgi:hypothetical protein